MSEYALKVKHRPSPSKIVQRKRMPRCMKRPLRRCDPHMLAKFFCIPQHVASRATYPEQAIHALATGLRKPTQGSKQARAILSTKDIAKIIALRKGGRKLKSIAAQFGVTPPTIIRVLNHTGWKHVPR